MGNSLSEVTAKRIKELRIKHDYTMETLAKKIGVSKSTIAKWENGYVDNMRQERISLLAEVFHVSPTYILGYDEIGTDQERITQFAELYSQLNDDQKILIDNMLKALSSKQ